MQHVFRLRNGLQKLSCSTTSFAAFTRAIPGIAKLSQQALGQVLNGQRDFDNPQDGEDFVRVLSVMEYLQENVQPKLPIDWNNVLLAKDVLVKTFEERRNAEDPMQNRLWFVRLNVHDFFKSLRSDGTESRTLNYYDGDAAAFTNYELAAKAVRKLKELNVPATAELLTCQRRESTIAGSLAELGFEIEKETL